MMQSSLYITWSKVFFQKREAFTQNSVMVSNNLAQYPKFNWVICHSPYSVAFYGVEGTDWGQTHYELPISWGRTIGSVLQVLMYLPFFFFGFSYNLLNQYDLYWAKSGTFYRYGDDRFINVRTPIFKPVTQQWFFIQHSGRIMATYSGPKIMEQQFTLA